MAKFASFQPQAALSAFTQGLFAKWNYLSRAMSFPDELYEPLQKTIRTVFIPALTPQPAPYDQTGQVLGLLARQGGLAITDPQTLPADQGEMSVRLHQPAIECILRQKEMPWSSIIPSSE